TTENAVNAEKGGEDKEEVGNPEEQSQQNEEYDSDESGDEAANKPEGEDINSQLAVGYKVDRLSDALVENAESNWWVDECLNSVT
ncbi:MAG: hypothetical protein Q9184_003680, partial [Pyrenodesmia sp. 2 TL-2023]